MRLFKIILDCLCIGQEMMKFAYRKAAQVVAAVWGLAKEHPWFSALVVLGILVIVAPWVIKLLGFGALGPIQGTVAAGWQSIFAGHVPAGSLFSFFQGLGMVWI
ncbi:hypothetical protein JOM56_001533 [Amanita muscaria]|uniref:Uncharacterized protein n=1 Tax=Amanita muscaria (strain Koide BX008) TaxID=946122 RepID=A0A0C2S6X2_AMAMK|nr:hypothetical protein M378DRAFT_170566 [Amanita muscaria Koide BX008]